MKFSELFKVMDADTRITIDYGYNMLSYTVDKLGEDLLFYEEIKDREVTSVWYSQVYRAIVIEIF